MKTLDAAGGADKAQALALCPGLRAIEAELMVYADLLRHWQKTINLVSTPSLSAIWLRHFADSAQAVEILPNAVRWVDLGSGAGFPGLVTALLLKNRSGALVRLIESDRRKAAFLRSVSRETNAPAEVLVGRIEDILPSFVGKIDAVSARALAPLPQLIRWSQDCLKAGAIGVFFKGEEWRDELTAAAALATFHYQTVESRTNARARLIVVAEENAQRQREGMK